uniref:Uncharacterized protein n=1 Tax=Panagrolaimus davidi TaxID=227884 RepID=A0A914QNX0_9BILA
MSPFLRGPPMSCVTLDFLQPPPLPPAATASSSLSVATKKKEYVPVSYIRIWTVLYDVYTKIDKCVDVVVLAPHNTKFFQRLIATNIIHITYCENYPILSNMLALLNWTDSCRFFLSARGFCEDFITFLKTLPRINAVCFRDVCSNESIFFDQLLNLLTNADELEIDMRHIKYNEDPGIILMQWKRPPTLKKFILYNLVKGTVSSSAVKQFCKEKVIPGGQINVTYEKYPKQC